MPTALTDEIANAAEYGAPGAEGVPRRPLRPGLTAKAGELWPECLSSRASLRIRGHQAPGRRERRPAAISTGPADDKLAEAN